MPRTRPPTGGTFKLGDLVEITAGPAKGLRGEIVAARGEPVGSRWLDVLTRAGTRDRTVRGLGPLELMLAHPCPYCGRGPCSGTARTANGRDLERFERVHPGRGIPARFDTDQETTA